MNEFPRQNCQIENICKTLKKCLYVISFFAHLKLAGYLSGWRIFSIATLDGKKTRAVCAGS
jgi:hypothetical protein